MAAPSEVELEAEVTVQERLQAMQEKLDLPASVVKDLLTFSGANIVVVVDDSSSMNQIANPENTKNPKTRWQELTQTLTTLLSMMLTVDTGGILLKPLSDPMFYMVRTEAELNSFLRSRKPKGETPLLSTLQAVLGGYRGENARPENDTLVVVLTDGLPSDTDMTGLQLALKEKDDRVYVSFVMCTNEKEVLKAYNETVDPIKGCDVTDDFRAEKAEVEAKGRTLTYSEYLAKAILGAKFAKYDEMDDRRAKRQGCCVVS